MACCADNAYVMLGQSLVAMQETLSSCSGKSEAQWNTAHPAYPEWLQLRLHHLQQGPSEWPEVLVQRVVALYSRPVGGSKPTARQKPWLRGSNAPSAGGTAAAPPGREV